MNAQIEKCLLRLLMPAALVVPGCSGHAQVAGHSATAVHRRVVVSVSDRKLALVENGKVKKVYIVAVGKKSSPSPAGTFRIMNRVTNPSYSHDGKVVPPGPANPVGTRWMGLSAKGYGIHGTNAPESIGKQASRGCIRMRKGDLEELFASVQTGDQVEILGDRDPEAAEIFGDAQSVEASVGTVAAALSTAPESAEATPVVAMAAAMPLAR